MRKTLILSAVLSLGLAGAALAQGGGNANGPTGNGTTAGGDAGMQTRTGAGTGGTNSGVATTTNRGTPAGVDKGNSAVPPASAGPAK